MFKIYLKKRLSWIICFVMMVALFNTNIQIQARTMNVPGQVEENLQDIINQASPGDIVQIPAGNYQISKNITINKPIILRGAGAENTSITLDDWVEFLVRADNVRIEGIRFIGDVDWSDPDDMVRAIDIGDYQDFCIINCEFVDLGYTVRVTGDNARGVVSNCTFTGCRVGVVVYGSEGSSWDVPLELGTGDAVFIEDCFFDSTIGVASNNGSKYVFRYNEFIGDSRANGQAVDVHGLEWSGHSHGSRSYEIYNNTIHHDSNHWTGIFIRGGDGVIYNNDINDCSPGILLAHRTTPNPPTDQYPGQDQTRSLYAWGNTLNGNPTGIQVRSGHQYLFQEGRDFWDDYGAGDTDFTSGLASSIPASCDPGDCYWATDSQTLYQCETEDTWSMIYTPYEYPHPLTADIVIPDPEVWDSKAVISEGIYTIIPVDGHSQLVKFDFVPDAADVNGVIGYADSDTSITGPESLFIKLSTQGGQLKAMNGTQYEATNQVYYTEGEKYLVKILVNFISKKFDVWVKPENGSEILLADDFSFSFDTADDIGQVCLKSIADGDFSVIDHSVIEYSPPPADLEVDWLSVDSFANPDGLHYLGEYTGEVNIEFDFIPAADGIDAVVGYSGAETDITAYNKLCLMFRANTDGYFDAYDRFSAWYGATNQVPYTANIVYHVRMEVDTVDQTFSIWITPENGSEVLLADNFGMPVRTPPINNIGKVFLRSNFNNAFGISNHLVNGSSAPTPTPTPTPVPGAWYSKCNFNDGIHLLGSGNTGIQLVEFDFIPHGIIDGVTGYAGYETDITAYSSFSLMVRANPGGYFDAINGTWYDAENQVPYSPNSTYHVKLLIDADEKIFSAWITPEGGTETIIAQDYAFRTTTSDNIGKVCLKSSANNEFSIMNHSISAYVEPTPTVTPTPGPSPGLLAEYLFLGDMNDSSGNGYHGVSINPPVLTEDRNEMPDSAYYFSGGTYIDCGDISGLGEGDFTAALWFKPDASPSSQSSYLLGKATRQFSMQPGDIGFNIGLHYTDEYSLRAEIRGDTGMKSFSVSFGSIEENDWHFVALVKTSDTIILYLDGETAGSAVKAVGDTSCPGYNLGMGKYVPSVGIQPYSGAIDEVRIYDIALTEEQLDLLYAEAALE